MDLFCPANATPKNICCLQSVKGMTGMFRMFLKGCVPCFFGFRLHFECLRFAMAWIYLLFFYIAVVPYYTLICHPECPKTTTSCSQTVSGSKAKATFRKWSGEPWPRFQAQKRYKLPCAEKRWVSDSTFSGTKKHEWRRYRLTQITVICDGKLQNDAAYALRVACLWERKTCQNLWLDVALHLWEVLPYKY